MPTLRFYCVICGTALTTSPDATNNVARCPSCSNMVPVPGRTGLSGRSAECVPVCPPEAIEVEVEVKFLCTACRSRLRADARLEGRSVGCPVCSEKTGVPRWSGTRVLPLEVIELELKFLCPSCKGRLRADARLAGRGICCPVCSEKIEAPRWSGVPDWPRAPARNNDRAAAATVFLSAEEIDFLSDAVPTTPGKVS